MLNRRPLRRESWSLAASLVLGISLLAACGGDSRSGVAEMQFNVDPERLGTPVEATALGIRFQPPAGWEPLSAADLDSVGRALSGNALDFRPRYLFSHPNTGSVLSVGTLDTEALTLEVQAARYGEALAAQGDSAAVKQGEYLKDGIHVVQFLVQAKGYITFTLFFSAASGGLLQFDYIVPRASYQGQVRAIESSIGSIQMLS